MLQTYLLADQPYELQSDLLEERRAVLQRWADFVTLPSAVAGLSVAQSGTAAPGVGNVAA